MLAVISIPTVARTTMPPVAYPLVPWEDVVSSAASSTERRMTASATRPDREALGRSGKWVDLVFQEMDKRKL